MRPRPKRPIQPRLAVVLGLAIPLLGCSGPVVVGADDPSPSEPFPAHIDRSTPIAIADVQVVPMDGERILENHTVLVRDGRVEALGPSADVAIPSDAHVLHGEGHYLLPGLADMHVHLARKENLILYLANGVTTIRNMWGTPVEILDWRDRIADGAMLGPRIYSASRGLDGSPPVWPTSIVVEDAASAAAAVDAEAALGFDFIKVYNSLLPEVYDAIVTRAEQVGVPVVGHVPRLVGLDHALASGQHTTEHLARYPTDPSDEALRSFARRHAEAPTWVTPTFIVRISFVNAEDAAVLEGREEMRFVHPAERANWSPTPGAPPRAVQRQQSRARGRVVRALKDRGVGVLVGTDSWISYVIHGFSIHDELRLLVEDASFSPYEALRAATVEAARSVGAEGEWGTVAPGLTADLLLLHENPLEAMAHVDARAGIVVGGTWLSDAELRRRLEELASRYAGGG